MVNPYYEQEGEVRNADRMNQRRVGVWHSSGRVRRKTSPALPGFTLFYTFFTQVVTYY